MVKSGTSVCSMTTDCVSETAGVLRASPRNFTRTVYAPGTRQACEIV